MTVFKWELGFLVLVSGASWRVLFLSSVIAFSLVHFPCSIQFSCLSLKCEIQKKNKKTLRPCFSSLWLFVGLSVPLLTSGSYLHLPFLFRTPYRIMRITAVWQGQNTRKNNVWDQHAFVRELHRPTVINHWLFHLTSLDFQPVFCNTWTFGNHSVETPFHKMGFVHLTFLRQNHA